MYTRNAPTLSVVTFAVYHSCRRLTSDPDGNNAKPHGSDIHIDDTELTKNLNSGRQLSLVYSRSRTRPLGGSFHVDSPLEAFLSSQKVVLATRGRHTTAELAVPR